MTLDSNDLAAGPNRGRAKLIAGAVAAGFLTGMAGVYGIGGFQRNAGGDAACQAAVDIAKRIAPFARGEVAAVTIATKPRRVPELAFLEGGDTQRTLQQWRGRFVLLNIWATYCGPCKEEMPALDALQTKLGGPLFEVVAVNYDPRDLKKAKIWLNENGISQLAFYGDSEGRVFPDLKIAGLAIGTPTSVLIDQQGCEIAKIEGPADWASDDAVKLVQAALAQR